MQSLSVDVNAMACGGCPGRLQRALRRSTASAALPLGVTIGVTEPARITPVSIESVAVQLGHPTKVRYEKEISKPLRVRFDSAPTTDRDPASGVAA